MKNLIKKILNEVNVPHHYQPTGNSCGPTCLKMVHDFFVGDRFKISDICRACGTDWVVGTPPERMIKGLNYMGIKYIEHINEEDPYQSLRDSIDKGHPCVVRANVGGTPHWIIVVDYKGDKLLVNDPWLGRLVYTIDEFDEIWLSGRQKIREYFYYEITGGDDTVYPDEEVEGYDEDEDYMEDFEDTGGKIHGRPSIEKITVRGTKSKTYLTKNQKLNKEAKKLANLDITKDFSGDNNGTHNTDEWYKSLLPYDTRFDYDYMEDESEMWSKEWVDNFLDEVRRAVDNEAISIDDLADFDDETGHQNWQSFDEILNAFVDWYQNGTYEESEEEEDVKDYGTQLELDFPEDDDEEVRISHFNSEKEIHDALKIGLKVFEGQMSAKNLLSYLAKAADWSISVKATYKGKVVGFYLLNENQMYDYIIHYMVRDYKCYTFKECNQKNPNSIKVNPEKFRDLEGVEGVALGVDPEYKGIGIGKKLMEYSQNLPYDYIWGQQYESLDNIQHWIKRRDVAAYFPGLYLTYQMLSNNSLNEAFPLRPLTKDFKDRYNGGPVITTPEKEDYNKTGWIDSAYIDDNGEFQIIWKDELEELRSKYMEIESLKKSIDTINNILYSGRSIMTTQLMKDRHEARIRIEQLESELESKSIDTPIINYFE